MHEAFKFPVECRFKQRRYRSVAWAGGYVSDSLATRDFVFIDSPPIEGEGPLIEGGVFEDVLVAGKDCEFETYEAFDQIDLLSSLYKLAKKMWCAWSGEDKMVLAKRWVEKYGFLGCNAPMGGAAKEAATWEALHDFLIETYQLTTLWQRYLQTTQRDLPALQEWISFVPRPEKLEDPFWPKDSPLRVDFANSFPYRLYAFGGSERDYQIAAVAFISHHIEQRLGRVALTTTQVWDKVTHPATDVFKVPPVIECHTLLQAMYLQFYLLLADTGTKIVCPACGALFEPPRTNVVYCSGTCYNTAKSRRFRGRKKIRGGKN